MPSSCQPCRARNMMTADKRLIKTDTGAPKRYAALTMNTPITRRTAVSAQLLLQLAAEHGLSAEPCLQGCGLHAKALDDPQLQITAAQELQLVGNLVKHLGHIPALGLSAGLRYPLSAYGIWGFALLTSPNFRAVADWVSRFMDLSYAFVQFRFTDSADGLWVTLHDEHLPPAVRRFLLERDLAACCNILRELRPGGIPIRALTLRGDAPDYADQWTRITGITPQFNAARNAARFDPADADAPLPQANPQLARMALLQCQQLLTQRRQRSGLAAEVRNRLLQTPAQIPGIDTIAADLHRSARTLRRHLQDEGTAFSTLVDEVRQTLAEELLSTANLKLEDVAQRLGYAEPASLIHAFKRWTGQTPDAWRKARLRGLDVPFSQR